MELVPGFAAALQGLSATMTAPTFASWTTLLTGRVCARRRAVTQMIRTAGNAAGKHISSYHRLFSAACWSLPVQVVRQLEVSPESHTFEQTNSQTSVVRKCR